jgi:hypothetical protein
VLWQGYIPAPEVFYCPTSKFAPGWLKSSWGNSGTQKSLWGDIYADPSPAGQPFIAYDSNPNAGRMTLATGADAYADTHKILAKLPTRLAIVSDWHGYVSSNAKYGNCPRNHGDYYFNYLAVDGAARATETLYVYLAVESKLQGTYNGATRMEILCRLIEPKVK